jgi:hypothetical protein
MSLGSNASNLGYGNIYPSSQINGNYVNKYSMDWPAAFSSNEIPQSTLYAAKNNVDAVNACVPGACYKGGKNKTSKKIKNNINKMYKKRWMKKTRKHVKTLKKKLRKLYKKKSKSKKQSRKLRGGYSQYMNNFPNTPTYSLGGVIPSSQLGLANPPPYQTLCNSTNCVDNYSHYTNQGFQSKGH